MNDILKQRLVGALILVALGVVFWPIIFVESGSKPLGEAAQIPVRPDVDTTAIAPPGKEGLRTSPVLEIENEDATAKAVEQPSEQVEKAPVPTPPDANNVVSAPIAEKKKTASVKPANTHTPRSKSPAKPAIDADGVPIAWILQVASVSNPEKADELRRRLIDMGYKGYVKKIKTGNATLLRVYVGPKFERAKLESIQPAINAEFKVKSMVRRYIP